MPNLLFRVLCLPGDQSHPFAQLTINPLACCICWTGLLGRAVFPPWNEGPNFGSYTKLLQLYLIFLTLWTAAHLSEGLKPHLILFLAFAGRFFTAGTTSVKIKVSWKLVHDIRIHCCPLTDIMVQTQGMVYQILKTAIHNWCQIIYVGLTSRWKDYKVL